MIKINNVRKEVEDRCILNIASLEFEDSGFDAILGESGAGKSTLLNIIGGIENNYDGEVYYNEMRIEKKSLNELRKKKISFIFQELNLLESISVRENIKIALNMAEIQWDEKKYIEILKKLGLENKSEKIVNKLSGGEKQRVAIARALLKESEVILADEPTGNLDEENADNIFQILSEISNYCSVILVTHDKELAYKYANRVVIIRHGMIETIDTLKNSKIVKLNEEKKNAERKTEKKKWIFKYALNEFWRKKVSDE